MQVGRGNSLFTSLGSITVAKDREETRQEPVGLNIRTIIEILALIRKLEIKKITQLPDIENPAEVRAWLLTVLAAADLLADYTAMTLDDDLIAQAILLIQDEQSWSSLYSIISFVYDLLDGKDDDEVAKVVQSRAVLAPAEALGKRVGMSPLLIIGIVQAAIALLRLLQQFRQNRNR
jgi:hypothetical protein